MATFASSELARKIADGEEDEPTSSTSGTSVPEEQSKPEPKRLGAKETQSIFALKNEFLKKRNALIKTKLPDAYVAGKSNVIAMKKEEKTVLLSEKAARAKRIKENEDAIRREENEKFAAANQKLKEKAELYDRLKEQNVVLHNSDNSPIEFMVDFNAKKRQKEAEKEREEEEGPIRRGREPSIERYHHAEEQRVYGVSHMRFSSNEEKRSEEIKELLDMSKKTLEERNKRKMQQAEKEKLRRAKIAKLRAAAGLPEKEPSPEPEVNLEEIPIPAPHETPEQRHERLIKSDREWDRGKGRYTTWIEKQRDERDDEFKPPESYFRK
ncbi:unnamed protein product [Caenorhabditis auriculariae]|uniref:Uncharacterized protein n=1 Tax=Caenorhabditis auriculariae TaxID=2777116 RepID=A0A8S1GS45_9PELO|nr:unnamed protein product [Caenorhabditis auriculariae]